MKIVVTGSHGLIGSKLVPHLEGLGHKVIRMVRTRSIASRGETYWNPSQEVLDPTTLEGYDAVVHLAGESIMGRWSEAKKRRIRQSRVRGTELLVRALNRLQRPPGVLVCASAIGFYGDRGSEVLDETSMAGEGFLSDVVQEWEAAANEVRDSGIRIAIPRIGVVLSKSGGALAKMLTPFRLGLGGRMGSGDQYMSWIHERDLVRSIAQAIEDRHFSGAFNAVSPNPVTQETFARTLGGIISRPTFFSMPRFLVRAVMGRDLADETVLSSARVLPKNLSANGFEFENPDLNEALESLLYPAPQEA